MKKRGKLFVSWLLCAAMTVMPVLSCPQVFAEEEYEEDYQENDRESSEEKRSEGEHTDAYYAEIQSDQISGWPSGPAVDADAAIVMDANTGTILYSKNIDKTEYPASITKLMTVLLALENGNLEDVVIFSEYAVFSIEYGSSHLGLTEGEELTLEQCLYGIMLASANEISNAVAEHIGGDVDHFVEMMNERAAQLGCTNTHFVNPHGLHDSDHYVSARDMALIMQAAMRFDKFREIVNTDYYFFPKTNKVDEDRHFMNHHKMVPGVEEGMEYDGVIGGKTGYTDESWNTLVTGAQRDGLELICVVLRCPGLYASYDDTKVLLDYGFSNFKAVTLDNTQLSKDNLSYVGVDDPEELAKIKEADFNEAPFALAKETVLSVPVDVDPAALTKTMDFSDNTLTYYYGETALGSSSFMYTGQWEAETETETQAETETETIAMTETETEAQNEGILGRAQEALHKVVDIFSNAYETMDLFIQENTVLASVIGAVLLIIFVPLLLVAWNRNRRYKKIMRQREQEMEMLRRMEEEIERKSAAQVEAELRAGELQAQLEEEKRKRRIREKQMKKLKQTAQAKGEDLAKDQTPEEEDRMDE